MNSPDWFAIITDLIYQGIPMKEVARHMDAKVSESMLRYYRSGGEPLYVRGEALVRFWCDRTGKTVDQLPRKPFARGHRMRVAPKMRVTPNQRRV